MFVVFSSGIKKLLTSEAVEQGTIEGVVISAVNLDNCIEDFFSSSEEDIYY